MSRWLRAAALTCGAALEVLCAPAHAASFFVSPVRIDLTGSVSTAVLSVRNEAERAVVVQVQLLAWSQSHGQDRLSDTKDLIATPPLFTIPGRGAQIVRVGLRKAPAAIAKEQTYRLILQEVPPPSKPGEPGITMALRLSLPIFVAASTPKGPMLSWRAEQAADGTLALHVENGGDTHAQITQLALSAAPSQRPFVELDTVSYVLAGEKRDWQLKPDPGPQSAVRRLHLKADTDAGRVETVLELPAR